MRTELLECYACGEETEHSRVGFMPLRFIGRASSRDDYDWANCAICEACGGLTVLPVSEEQLERAHDRYLRLLVDADVMTAAEVKQQTGVDIRGVR